MHLYCKTKKGIEYFYLRHTEWRNGKTVCAFQKYIGNKQKLMEVIQNGLHPIAKNITPENSEVYSFGAVAVLLELCNKIDLFRIIDQCSQKRNQDLPISYYLIIAAINRAINAKSKNSMVNWAKGTSLSFLLNKLDLAKLTSQHFWNHMNLIDVNQIHQAEDLISRNVVATYQLPLNVLLYDSTNYYSYIHTFNTKPAIEQRGKNKQKRKDLRQANFALLVTKEHHIPLYHKVYDGNENDYKGFKSTILSIRDKISCFDDKNKKIVLVFDAGNVSADSMNLIEQNELKFISKLRLSEHKDILKVPLKSYETIERGKYKGLKFYETKKNLYGSEKTVIIKFNSSFYEAERITFSRQLAKATETLSRLAKRLKKYERENKLPWNVNFNSVTQAISPMFAGKYFLKQIIRFKIEQKGRFPITTWRVSKKKIAEFCDMYLGKTIYFTNYKLSAHQVITTYAYQNEIERLFKISKNRQTGCWWPKYHWTDQKIRVHAFYCYLSLLLQSLLEMELSSLGVSMENHNLMDELNKIYEIIDQYSNGPGKKLRIKRHSTLSADQKMIFNHFKLHKYFTSSA